MATQPTAFDDRVSNWTKATGTKPGERAAYVPQTANPPATAIAA